MARSITTTSGVSSAYFVIADFAGLRFPDHRHLGDRLQQQAKARAHDRVIVDQHHANHDAACPAESRLSTSLHGLR